MGRPLEIEVTLDWDESDGSKFRQLDAYKASQVSVAEVARHESSLSVFGRAAVRWVFLKGSVKRGWRQKTIAAARLLRRFPS